MRTLDYTGQFKRDYRREKKGRHRLCGEPETLLPLVSQGRIRRQLSQMYGHPQGRKIFRPYSSDINEKSPFCEKSQNLKIRHSGESRNPVIVL